MARGGQFALANDAFSVPTCTYVKEQACFLTHRKYRPEHCMPMLSLKHFLLRAEGKALYRDTLRALRGVDAATAQSIRESARAMYADNAAESDPDRIRVLLIDGRCVRPLPISLRCAQIERWALPPTFHSPPPPQPQPPPPPPPPPTFHSPPTHLPLAAHPPPTRRPPTSHPPPSNIPPTSHQQLVRAQALAQRDVPMPRDRSRPPGGERIGYADSNERSQQQRA